MSAETFTTCMHRTRDGMLPLEDSYFERHTTPESSHHQICCTMPLEELTTHDLAVFLLSAAASPTATHLLLYIYPGRCADAADAFEELMERFYAEYGFEPSDAGTFLNPGTEEDLLQAAIVSLFSDEEEQTALYMGENA